MNAKEQIGIAVIGCGAIAWANAAAIEASKNARLAYAVDVNSESAARLGQKYKIPSGTDLAAALKDESVDAVFICAPHFQHAPLAEAAARAGKQVIVEKPMGANLEESELIVSACREAGVKLGVCYCMRYSRKIKFIKEYIAAGGLGRITGFEIVMIRDRSENYLKRNTWQEINPIWHGDKAKAGGGIVINNGSHYIDYLLYLTGIKIETVYSSYSTYNLPVNIEESLSSIATFGKGGIGSITMGNSIPGCGTEQNEKITNSLQRIWGTEGHILLIPELKIFSKRRVLNFEPNCWHKIKPARVYNSLGSGLAERREFVENFARAVLEDSIPDISGEDGLRVMRIMDAVYRSGEAGKPVTI